MITVRTGTQDDLPHVFNLVRELAEYENALHEVTNSIAMMEQDAFGENPVFGFFVAEEGKTIVGLSLYYYRYSTWKGKRLYLEDIVVTKNQRGKGIGHLLFEETMRFSISSQCTGMMWQVLDWNEPAINFYRKYDARFDSEWVNCHLEAEQIKSFLTKTSV